MKAKKYNEYTESINESANALGLEKNVYNIINDFYKQDKSDRFENLNKNKLDVRISGDYTTVKVDDGQGYTKFTVVGGKITQIETEDPSGKRQYDSTKDYYNNKMSGGKAYKSY